MPGPVFLAGDRVDLRTFEREDLEREEAVFGDPDRRRRMGPRTPHSRREQEEWFESLGAENAAFAVSPAGEARTVGCVMLSDLDSVRGNAEIGAWVHPDETGRGYATAGLSLLVTYAFAERRLHRLDATTLADNHAARRVLEKLGFAREGTRRDATTDADGDGYVDELRYGLLEAEWSGPEDVEEEADSEEEGDPAEEPGD